MMWEKCNQDILELGKTLCLVNLGLWSHNKPFWVLIDLPNLDFISGFHFCVKGKNKEGQILQCPSGLYKFEIPHRCVLCDEINACVMF